MNISSATGEPIRCSGQAKMEIHIPSLRRTFSWTFVIAETVKPLLGYDFLQNYGLLVDCKKRTLKDSVTSSSVNLAISNSTDSLSINNVELPVGIKQIFDMYPSLTSPHLNPDSTYCGIYHRINTGNNQPVHAKTRQLSETKLLSAQEDFRRLQSSGVISPSNSEWSSALHMVQKPDGSFRACGDYRSLNSITVPDRYPIPNINSFSAKLSNSYIFSKIDLLSAYHQIRMHPDDIKKTALTTPFGLFQFNYMPFGLRNAASTFQRMIDRIFSHLNFVFAYQDDILVFSDNLENHVDHLKIVIEILNKYDLKISLRKCIFNVSEIDFLGYSVSGNGIRPSKAKLEELKEFPYPNDSKSLRRFLGMIDFY